LANLISYQSGNIDGATTWKITETGTAAEKATLAVANSTNTTTSDVYNADAQDFTITNLDVIEGLLLYCKQTTATGTVRVTLSEDSGVTATKTVTVNATDLPTSPSWVFFKFGTTLTGDGGTDYAIAIQGSSAGNATFYRATSTAADWNHLLRTDQIKNPAAAGDNLYVVGDWTAAATGSAYTVTMTDTASTDYGTIDVCDSGTLTSGTSAATNYTLKHSGNFNVWGDGTYSIGTTGTPIPRGSTYTQTMDCTSNVEFGMIINAGGTFNSQALSRTSGKDIYYCKLNTDEAAAQTTLGVDTDTGWLNGDVIAIASTSRTASECESRTLNANANASDMTVSSGLTNAHSGTSPTQAEVILLTRSIVIQGASASLQGYISFVGSTSVIDIDWTEFKWMGSATSTKVGLNLATSSSASWSFSIQYSSLHDFAVTSSIGFNVTGAAHNGWTFSNNTTFNCANNHFAIASATSGTWTADSNIFMRNTDSANLVSLSDIGGTFTNNTMVGGASTGLAVSENSTIGTISGNTIHSGAATGLNFNGTGTVGTVSTLTCWRNSGAGINGSTNAISDLTFSTFTLFGNGTSNINLGSSGDVTFISGVISGDSTFSTTNGINEAGVGLVNKNYRFYSCTFGVASGIKTAHTNDVNVSGTPASMDYIFNNCILASTNEVTSQSNMNSKGFIGSEKNDQTAGLHKTWKKYGTITIDTTIFNTASPSERLTPNNASNKLISGIKKAAINNGETLTPTVYVRESVVGDGTDYDGARPRLIVKRNDAVGITADTVLDTATVAAEGAFEALTGTTGTATDDGVLEFYIDCDGTTGWVNTDDWAIA